MIRVTLVPLQLFDTAVGSNKKIIISQGAHKSVYLVCSIMAKAQKWTLINYRHSGPFYHHFCTETDNIVFHFAKSECARYPKLTAAPKGLS